jgi:hypothetical protein
MLIIAEQTKISNILLVRKAFFRMKAPEGLLEQVNDGHVVYGYWTFVKHS